MAPYLSAADANARLLSRFAITATVNAGDVDIASDALDAKAPFLGEKYDPTQARQFPRTSLRGLDVAEMVPEAVLDYVALRAAYSSQAENMEVLSSHGLGPMSKSYARPKTTKLEAYLKSATATVNEYQRKNGRLV